MTAVTRAVRILFALAIAALNARAAGACIAVAADRVTAGDLAADRTSIFISPGRHRYRICAGPGCAAFLSCGRAAPLGSALQPCRGFTQRDLHRARHGTSGARACDRVHAPGPRHPRSPHRNRGVEPLPCASRRYRVHAREFAAWRPGGHSVAWLCALRQPAPLCDLGTRKDYRPNPPGSSPCRICPPASVLKLRRSVWNPLKRFPQTSRLRLSIRFWALSRAARSLPAPP